MRVRESLSNHTIAPLRRCSQRGGSLPRLDPAQPSAPCYHAMYSRIRFLGQRHRPVACFAVGGLSLWQ